MGSLLKERLSAGKLVKVFGVGQLLSAKFVEILGWTGGYDAVWFDSEHAGVTMPQIEQGALAARAHGMDSFVRLAATDYAAVMRPLEAGAGGIMAAQVRSAEQTEEIVRWARFHPRGLRGWNGLGSDGRFGLLSAAEYLARAAAETLVAIQIEHFEAVEDIEGIARVPDVDLLFIGPADLSQSMGITGEWDHSRIWTAVERVAAAARKHGKAWAIVPASPAAARRCLELGCRCLAIGFDTLALHAGIKAAQREYPEVFGQKA